MCIAFGPIFSRNDENFLHHIQFVRSCIHTQTFTICFSALSGSGDTVCVLVFTVVAFDVHAGRQPVCIFQCLNTRNNRTLFATKPKMLSIRFCVSVSMRARSVFINTCIEGHMQHSENELEKGERGKLMRKKNEKKDNNNTHTYTAVGKFYLVARVQRHTPKLYVHILYIIHFYIVHTSYSYTEDTQNLI